MSKEEISVTLLGMRSNPLRILLASIFLILIFSIGVTAGGFAMFAFAPASSGDGRKEIIEIRKGEPGIEIARILESKGAVKNARKLLWLGRVTRQWPRIKAGEYEVSPNMTPLQIFGVITSGLSVAHPVTVREGENMYEIAADLESKKLAPRAKILALCRDPQFIATLGLKSPLGPTLEGFLYPDTYFFNRTMSPEDMIRQMVRRFHSAWTPQETARAVQLGMNQLQVMTLASMVEKETGAPAERPLISSVFHNRLRKRMRLQSDPTTIYGIWETYQGNIHRSDLLTPSPFNTYTLPGLPTGPISNPGKEAIQAALNPLKSNYIFFVSHNDGTHEFTINLDDHNRAVRKFQMDPRARNGKSWRDLKKTPAAPSAGVTQNR